MSEHRDNLTPYHCPHCDTKHSSFICKAHFETSDPTTGSKKTWVVYACERCGGVFTIGLPVLLEEKTMEKVRITASSETFQNVTVEKPVFTVKPSFADNEHPRIFTVKGQQLSMDEPDYKKLLEEFGAKAKIETVTAKGKHYAVIRRSRNGKRETIPVARFILGIVDKKERLVSFKDLNPLNMQRSNMLIGSRREVMKRRRSGINSSSKYVGVHWSAQHKKWRAVIKPNQRQGNKHLGLFDNQDDAALAYNAAAEKYHGGFANLNVIP